MTLCPLPRSFVLAEGQKRYFEKLVIYCDQYASLIPVSFVLGAFAPEFPTPHTEKPIPRPLGDPPFLFLWGLPLTPQTPISASFMPAVAPVLETLDVTWSQ